jgi:LuxR family maltose regulon positive regulatory protein
LLLQPARVQEFLLSTSILHELSAPLCDRLTGEPDGAALLDLLVQRSLFVTAVGEEGGTFRYHPVVRVLLRQHLRAASPGRDVALLEAAANWHLERAEISRAVPYLIEAEAWELALASLLRYGGGLIDAGEAALVATWVGAIPRSARENRQDIALVEGVAHAMGGDLNRAGPILSSLEARPELDDGLRLTAHLARAVVELHRGDPASARRTADSLLAELSDCNGPFTGMRVLAFTRDDLYDGAHLIRGTSCLYLDDVAEADRSLDVALKSRRLLWQIDGLGAAALLAATKGQLRTAEQRARRSLGLADDLGAGDQPPTAEAHLALAQVAVARSDIDSANTHLMSVGARLLPGRRPMLRALAAVELAQVALADGRPRDAALAVTSVESGDGPRLPEAIAARVRALDALTRIGLGDLEGATAVLDRAPCHSTLGNVARVRLAIERSDLADAAELVTQWDNRASGERVPELEIWASVVAHLQGDALVGQARLCAALALAEPDHRLDVFRHAAHWCLGPVRARYVEEPSPFLRCVIEALPASSPEVPVSPHLVEQITEREYSVLVLLPTRMSNQDIATRLGVSRNTVKTHLKHIYRKLGVDCRSEAVAVAERQRLV